MVADRLSQWTLLYTMSTLKIHQTQYDDSEDVDEAILFAREKGRELYYKIKRVTSGTIVIALFIWLAGLWHPEIPYISRFATVLFDTTIILTLALIFLAIHQLMA